MTPALYSIDNFNTERGLGMGHYGCNIVLAKEAVSEILGIELKRINPALVNTLTERVKKSIRHAQPNFHFHKDSFMLTSFQIGGQCACLGIDGSELLRLGSENVRYSPHNIDSPEYAAVLVSTWLLWFNSVISLTDLHQPYA